jgi:hypothetical protein
MGTKKPVDPVKVDYIEVWAYLMGLYLTWKIGDKEFRVKFQKEIEDWLKYKDEKRFGEMIEKVIKKEMQKFHIKDSDIEKIVKEMIKKPNFTITILEALT